MSSGISGTKTQSEQWAESRKAFIQARDDLVRLAERGTTKTYRDIVADWTTVRTASMPPPVSGYPAKKTTFETSNEPQYLELTTSDALTRCHERFVELMRQYFAKSGVVDFTGLTHLERKYLKAHRP